MGKQSPINAIFYRIVLMVLSFPLSFILARFLPQIIVPITENGMDATPLICLLGSLLLLEVIFYPLRKVVSIIGLIGCIALAFFYYRGDIRSDEIKHFSKRLLGKVSAYEYFGKSIRNQDDLEKATAMTDEVHEFVASAKQGFQEQGIAFSIFSTINTRWAYKNDPQFRELYRPASETVKSFTGDCDDHSILMTTCLKAAGFRSRIVFCEGHAYPELHLGDRKGLEKTLRTIAHIYGISKNKIHYKTDNTGYWLNMDYSAKHPGGPYANDYDFEKWEP